MHDARTIRRRRAVLALLVVSSLVLLTASFGGDGGPLRSVQRGVFEVLSPVQEGASRATKPVRDLFGWVGDTFDAKGENEELTDERDALRQQVARLRGQRDENAELRKMLDLDEKAELSEMGPVTARVTGAAPSVLDQRLTINKGSDDGVREDQPVITGAGLVGKISFVTGGSAVVELLTDADFGVRAKVAESGVTGTIEAAPGSPRALRLTNTTARDTVARGETVVTRGTDGSPRLPSLFPPDIPIGTVTRIDEPGTDAQRVRVRPFADPRSLSFVQVLTDTAGVT